jgi:Predicted integral membrane protein
MPSIVQGYEYDIFISYRQKDNQYDGWVTEFVGNLKRELDATFKEEISVYFDFNSHDGLLETHDINASLKEKLKCLIFIPIISQTYCDLRSFAWQHEFCVFNKVANEDLFGRDIRLNNGNVASRILPVKINNLDDKDTTILESELGAVLRAIEFIFKSPGVNRPLTPSDNPDKNQNHTFYRDQINKVANSIQEIIRGIKKIENLTTGATSDESLISKTRKLPFRKKLTTRNVLRAIIVYILTAVIFWKVVVISSALLNLTENTVRLIYLLLIVLFPFAILMAWLYERSPMGFIRIGSVASLGNPFTDEQKKPFTSNTFISLLLVITVALFLLFPKVGKTQSPTRIANVDKSIAVLPFVDLSPDHDKEYFSDGMMEEILNNLYKIGDLKVTSRTSSMQYKGETKKSIKEIAAELGVANILEGSVRLYKNTVRITVQLIRAGTDEHLWAEDYDRNFSDIFYIQSEVAQEVAKALKAEISPEVKRIIDLKPTTNPEAYNLYLKAENLGYFNENDKNKALELYKKAIELDPDFSLAYSAIGFILTTGATYISSSKGLNLQETWKIAKPYFEKALAINPDNGEAHYLFAWSLLWFEWNFKAAYKEYKEARRIFPNYSWTDYHLALGQFDEAYEGAINNIDFDSKNALSWTGIITSSYFANHDPENEIRKALTIPIIRDNIYVRSESARIYMYLKEYDEAISLTKELLKDFPKVESPRLDAVQAISYFNTNRPAETSRIIAKLKQRSEVNAGGSPSFHLAMIYAQMGKINDAFKWLEKAYRDHEVEMYWLKVEPAFDPLHSDPRLKTMLDKIGYP